MTAYIVVSLKTKDPERASEYSQKAAKTFTAFGGEIITKGISEGLHGDPQFPAKAILKFPSIQHARDWYKSKAYQELISLRDSAMQSVFELITEPS